MSTTTPNPTSSSAATTTTTTTTRPFSATATTTTNNNRTPPRPHPATTATIHHLYQSPLIIRPQQQQIPNSYPLSSSGRGFIPRATRPPDPPAAYPPRASATAIPYRPPTHLDYHLNRHHPTHLHHHHLGGASAPIKGIPVTGQLKVALSPVSDSNGHKNIRSRDDNVITVRERKVRISDGASLYSLCRSWLRNGSPEECQPHCGDGVKSLPRPLPIPVVDTLSPKKKEGDEVEEDEEDNESVDHLSTEDLLKRHIKRAKRVRARLREGRLKRIARYKTRLALLLPPHVEQLRNDTAAGN